MCEFITCQLFLLIIIMNRRIYVIMHGFIHRRHRLSQLDYSRGTSNISESSCGCDNLTQNTVMNDQTSSEAFSPYVFSNFFGDDSQSYGGCLRCFLLSLGDENRRREMMMKVMIISTLLDSYRREGDQTEMEVLGSLLEGRWKIENVLFSSPLASMVISFSI